MFWLFAVYVGAVLVACIIISMLTGNDAFPGMWGHGSDGPRIPHGGPHKPAFAGRSP